MNFLKILGLERNTEPASLESKNAEEVTEPNASEPIRTSDQHKSNPDEVPQVDSADQSITGKAGGVNDNVLNLSSRKPPTARDYRNYGATRKQEAPQEGLQFKGLLDDPFLKDFFAQNHWQFGNYDGATYRSYEQLELGKQAVVARFQNALANYVSKKKSHLTKLKATVLETNGVCRITTQQLELACEHVQEEIKSLTEQMELSKIREGWVTDALSRYEIGFVKGLRATIPFDHLL